MKYPTKKQIQKMGADYHDELHEAFIGTNIKGINVDDNEEAFLEGVRKTIALIKKINKNDAIPKTK